jgi:hypothetical protein
LVSDKKRPISLFLGQNEVNPFGPYYLKKGANKMEREINLEAKDFSNFLRCLSVLKDICKDVDIRGGVLRQRSTDTANIFEMDLSPLISDCDICIDNLKGKLTLLKGLSKQEVQITITDDEIYFSGKSSTFKFKNPNPSYMNDRFMSNEEFSKFVTVREEDLVLEHVVTKDISNFMKLTADQFNIVSFQVLFDGNVASMTASTTSKDKYSEIEYGIPLKKPLKGFLNIVATPFLLDRDRDMLFKMYNVQEDLFINKFTASIGKIAVDVYGRNQLIEEEESSTLPGEEGGE